MNGEFIIAINGEQKTEERDGVTVITLKPELREQIVRCRDCKEFSFGNTAHKTVDWCDYWCDCVDSLDGFCKWGERKAVGE